MNRKDSYGVYAEPVDPLNSGRSFRIIMMLLSIRWTSLPSEKSLQMDHTPTWNSSRIRMKVTRHPIPINHKASLTPDKLPSGQKTDPNTKILFPIYAMERMKSIWGEDCLEFKPERWISERENSRMCLQTSYSHLAQGQGYA